MDKPLGLRAPTRGPGSRLGPWPLCCAGQGWHTIKEKGQQLVMLGLAATAEQDQTQDNASRDDR